MADGPVLTASGQFPEGYCNTLLCRDTLTVVCVPSAHDMPDSSADVLKRLPGRTEILHKLLRAEIRNNCVPPVFGW